VPITELRHPSWSKPVAVPPGTAKAMPTCTAGRRAPRHNRETLLSTSAKACLFYHRAPRTAADALCIRTIFWRPHGTRACTHRGAAEGTLASAPVIFSTYFVTAASVSFGSVTRSHPTTAQSSARASSYLKAKEQATKRTHSKGCSRSTAVQQYSTGSRVAHWWSSADESTSQSMLTTWQGASLLTEWT
jgi:hypothetical protein